MISGYLITMIILVEKERDTFSLINFYERRARRILPVLFLVMLVSLLFSWFWLLPSDMKDFSKSLIATSLFTSNILFWHETGYWGAANEIKPLLHTWSLAVEEQYYVLFPLFLMLMWRFRKRWILASFMVVALFSLMLAQWGVHHNPTATFFLLPTRGWELALGACIAFYFLYRKREMHVLLSHRYVTEAMGILGLLFIGYAVFFFDETVPFPGLYALIPTLGAGLIIIFSSPETIIGRLLGTKLLVGIGLISYSAYLWHQPLFAFARHRSLTELTPLHYMGLIVLSLVLAYVTWRYVERPFRTKGVFSRKLIFTFAVAGSVLFTTIGLIGHLSNGFEIRSSKSELTLQTIEEKLQLNYGLSETCEESFTLSSDCRTSNEPEILVWGDSFAMHLVQGILASEPSAKVIQLTKSVCGPLFDVAPITSKYPISWAQGCLEFTGSVREWIKTNRSVKYVVISSPFSQYVSESGQLLLRDGDVIQANEKIALKERL